VAFDAAGEAILDEWDAARVRVGDEHFNLHLKKPPSREGAGGFPPATGSTRHLITPA
jgi:hypothetical protein